MVELKAVETVLDVHKAQAINYLEAYGISDGLLLNFGGRRLEFNRLYNKKNVQRPSSHPVHPENPVNRVQNGKKANNKTKKYLTGGRTSDADTGQCCTD